MDSKKQRGQNVTQARFDACVANMLEQGIEPKVTLITQEIGGSYTTIAGFLEQWKQSQSALLNTVIGIPDYVQKAFEAIGQSWWAQVQEDVNNRIQQANLEADRRVENYQSERDEFLASTDDYKEALEAAELKHREECDALIKTHTLSLTTLQDKLTQSSIEAALDEQSVAHQLTLISERDTKIIQLETQHSELKATLAEQVKNNNDVVTQSKADITALKVEHKSQFDLMKKTLTQQNEALTLAISETTKSAEKVEAGLNKLLTEKDTRLAALTVKITEQATRIAELEAKLVV